MHNVERIQCAAIHYNTPYTHEHQPKNITTGYVICGLRHHNCIQVFSQIVAGMKGMEIIKLKNGSTQGFLTSTNRFVNRLEGLVIAIKAGQVTELKDPNKKELYSEDLY